jgi:CDP-paratose 2-epimerase
MRLVITGACGFVGSEIALQLALRLPDARLVGMDNLSRPGSETNRPRLQAAGIAVTHGDVRSVSDLEGVGAADWVIDAAANPSVRAGVDGRTTSRQVVEHNLIGTLNLLEFCKSRCAGLVLLSTNRVYSIRALTSLPLVARERAFVPDVDAKWPAGASPAGITESFSTAGPVSLYGATKLASEAIAVEYGDAFDLPVVIDRCGVLAGAGQFGTAEQGIFSYWVRAWASGRPLTYYGFDGTGYQVRDALHATDLANLIERQLRAGSQASGLWAAGGGGSNAMSLAQLSAWCGERFGPRQVHGERTHRQWDVPWLVMDTSRTSARFEWSPTVGITRILDEIAEHHTSHPDWLTMTDTR